MRIHQRAPFMQLIFDLLAHLIQAQTDSLSSLITQSMIESFAGYHLKVCCFEVNISLVVLGIYRLKCDQQHNCVFNTH